MSPIDRFRQFGWLAVYYRQIATPDFLLLMAQEQWRGLRAHVQRFAPHTGCTSVETMDRMGNALRPHLLQWLEERRAPYTSYSRRTGAYLYDINIWETSSLRRGPFCARVVNLVRLESGNQMTVNAALQDAYGPTRHDACSNMEAALEHWVKLEDTRER